MVNYDLTQIKYRKEIINGEEVVIQMVPVGMRGPGKRKLNPRSGKDSGEDKVEESGTVNSDPRLYKEYQEYMEEGMDPDSDEIRRIKDKIESDQSYDLLDEAEDFEDFKQ